MENPTLDRYPAKNSTNSESKQLTEFLRTCKMFDCATHTLYNRQSTRFFQNFRAQELIASMHLIDVNVVSVRVSPNHISDHNALIVQVDIPFASVARQRILEKQRNMLSK